MSRVPTYTNPCKVFFTSIANERLVIGGTEPATGIEPTTYGLRERSNLLYRLSWAEYGHRS